MDPNTLASRSAREVLDDHLDLARSWDFETDLERNFAPDIVLMTTYGIFRGVEGLREKVRLLQKQLPDGQWTYHRIMVERHLGFLEWSGVGKNGARVEDGADSYLIEDGKIRAMTIHYTVIPGVPPEA
ncbi:nuclear transport factor 2 family protein [Lujinxingia vulgaris]|uniref:Nuclear transport factor 2 family protein n=1 Tax=Lujinxingia vulgaris TaxID=2600176 RepID=A0A5C6X1Y2_9DELT|nr:nuclear transport factor 2 family protein [Lujinxingia vulgaris]TXD34271.1 nuclear transport factor 2 family protein [Lujinxingia vulgaris]